MFAASERYGSNDEEYLLSGDQNNVKVVLKEELQRAKPNKPNRVKNFIKSVFLPQGYPDSVSEDYLEYQFWDTLQAFCSSITGLLATQAVLKGYGVGDETATVAGATITWMLKDGMGMVGRILFAWLKGTQLDCDAKRWRLFADILRDFATLLDLCAPLFNHFFVVIVCLSSVARSLVGVAGGATRAAFTLHQARRDNMADVSAKDGSQETLVNLMALLAGFVITPLVADNQVLVWFLFFVFTFLHLLSNYRAVCCVVMETLNIPRLNIALQNYIRTSEVMNPKEVAKIDPVLSPPDHTYRVKPGARLAYVLESASDLRPKFTSSTSTYILGLDRNRRQIDVCYHADVESSDVIKGCFHALLLDFVLKHHQDKKKMISNFPEIVELLGTIETGCGEDRLLEERLLEESGRVVEALYPAFEEGLKEQGWDLKICHLGVDEWRFRWNNKKDQ